MTVSVSNTGSSPGRRRYAGFWNGLWTTERPRKRKTAPLSASAFGGCKGAKAPCRKGVLAAANAPLSLAGAKTKSEPAERTGGLQGTHGLRGEKGDRNAGGTPCKAFHFALRFGEELRKIERKRKCLRGCFRGEKRAFPICRQLPRKRPPVKCVRFPERILPVRSSPVQPFLLTAAEAFRRALLKGFSLRLLLEGP